MKRMSTYCVRLDPRTVKALRREAKVLGIGGTQLARILIVQGLATGASKRLASKCICGHTIADHDALSGVCLLEDGCERFGAREAAHA